MDFENIDWHKGNGTLLNYLDSIKEPNYRDFSKKLTPGEFTMLGVRIPILKNIAKSISKGDYEIFLKLNDKNIFELRLIKGQVIANLKDLDEYKKYLDEFIPLIDNWAICDTFLCSSKIIKKDRPYFYRKARSLLNTRDEFENRVAFLILLCYFVEKDYLDDAFELIKGYESDKYYANMALAWLLSVMFVKFPEETKIFLLENPFDEQVTKYTIRKIKDSYRVSKENKEWLKNIS